MNIFYLDNNPKTCAQLHCDKHVVKMIIEYAQLMSTAHRMLDGEEYIDRTKLGRRIKRWKLSDPKLEEIVYKASHVNHPSAKWTRINQSNYLWLYNMWYALCDEYTYRYGKTHATFDKLAYILNKVPKNIPVGKITPVPQAMPDYCKMDLPIDGYRKYYRLEKQRFAKWTNRQIPEWFNANLCF
jgi:hypothetical protein